MISPGTSVLVVGARVTGRVYGVFGPPTAYLIDRQGRLVGRVAGPRDWGSEAGRRLVEALLQAPATP